MSANNFRKYSKFTPLSGIISSTVEDFKKKDQIIEELINKFWPQTIGSLLSKHVKIQRYSNCVLYLKALDKSWEKPLMEQKKVIIKKLNRYLNKEAVKDIIIKTP